MHKYRNCFSCFTRFKKPFLLFWRKVFTFPIPKSVPTTKLAKIHNFSIDELSLLNPLMPNFYPFDLYRRHTLEATLRRAARLFSYLPLMDDGLVGTHIADLGSGRGGLALHAARSGARDIAAFDLDNSNFMHFTDQEREVHIPSTISCVKCDICNADLKEYESHFDMAVSHNMLEHVSNPEKSLKNIAQIVKRGGYFLLKAGPLFNSPEGPHIFDAVKIPYYHHLFSDNVIRQYLSLLAENGQLDPVNMKTLNSISVTGRKNDPYPTVNRYNALDYYRMFSQSKDWTIIRYESSLDFRSSWMLRLFPSYLSRLGSAELFTCSIISVLRRI